MNNQELKPKIVLAVGAHPDDMDFGASGSLAKFVQDGAIVYYLIVTDGSKGTDDRKLTSKKLIRIRQDEQRAAAKIIGAADVFFLGYPDGELEVTMDVKRAIARVIRTVTPDVVITMNPDVLFDSERGFINHPDHRAAAQATLDAVFPLARDFLSLPELYKKEKLEPHKVSTVLLTSFGAKGNFSVDISSTIDTKIEALKTHASQMPADFAATESRVRSFAAEAGKPMGVAFAENFIRLNVQ